MQTKKVQMRTIFKALSEKDKDIIIRIAKSVKFTQQTMEQEISKTKTERPA